MLVLVMQVQLNQDKVTKCSKTQRYFWHQTSQGTSLSNKDMLHSQITFFLTDLELALLRDVALRWIRINFFRLQNQRQTEN